MLIEIYQRTVIPLLHYLVKTARRRAFLQRNAATELKRKFNVKYIYIVGVQQYTHTRLTALFPGAP